MEKFGKKNNRVAPVQVLKTKGGKKNSGLTPFWKQRLAELDKNDKLSEEFNCRRLALVAERVALDARENAIQVRLEVLTQKQKSLQVKETELQDRETEVGKAEMRLEEKGRKQEVPVQTKSRRLSPLKPAIGKLKGKRKSKTEKKVQEIQTTADFESDDDDLIVCPRLPLPAKDYPKVQEKPHSRVRPAGINESDWDDALVISPPMKWPAQDHENTNEDEIKALTGKVDSVQHCNKQEKSPGSGDY